MSKKKQILSDHALVRYCERAKGIDMQGIRDLIVTNDIKSAIKAGATKIMMPEGTYIIKEGIIATFI